MVLEINLLASLSLASACLLSPPMPSLAKASLPLVGNVSREQIEESFGDCAGAPEKPLAQDTAQLAKVPMGANIDIYLGTWCGDSKRELRRFWQALDTLPKELPFTIRYIALDRAKKAPELSPELDIRFVPTFIIARNGKEQGRIIESAPQGIESALLELLTKNP